jgi:hypothetical protein
LQPELKGPWLSTNGHDSLSEDAEEAQYLGADRSE